MFQKGQAPTEGKSAPATRVQVTYQKRDILAGSEAIFETDRCFRDHDQVGSCCDVSREEVAGNARHAAYDLEISLSAIEIHEECLKSVGT